jgi:SAM-dependent methyltransferase
MITTITTTATRSLDLGSGPEPKNFFNADEVYGIDIVPGLGPTVFPADLAIEPIPFVNENFDFVTAYDFIEHVPRILYLPQRRNPFIELMNEIDRVLKPGGQFMSLTPAYPHREAFWDPTHVNIITEETFLYYFCEPKFWARNYGFRGSFKMISQRWAGPTNAHLETVMQKVSL